MPFFFHPLFIPAMYLGAVMAFMPYFAMMYPTPPRECKIIPFPRKKRLTD